ncbi:hypothetical protein V8G54_004584 [Vigna mungo]|uniref:Vesicle transport v-SNARE N-terminal domain-containing protein n=1 Tax=Vigna mungo TaxID=3915 RepID=A0AAQ3PCL2_VIGMU
MSNVFEGYERQYCELSENLTKKCTAAGALNGEEAYELIDKFVVEHGVSYDDCCSSLVISLIRIKKLDEAMKLFMEMLSGDVRPDTLASSLLLKELCIKDLVLDGFYLLEAIQNKGCLSAIDSSIYSILLFGLCQRSHVAEPTKLAKIMLKKSVLLQPPYKDRSIGDFDDKMPYEGGHVHCSLLSLLSGHIISLYCITTTIRIGFCDVVCCAKRYGNPIMVLNLIKVGGVSDHGINMMRNIEKGDAYFRYMPNMVDERTTSSQPSQLSFMQNKSHVGVPPNSTDQFGESLKWFNQFDEFEWLKESNGTKDLSNSVLGNFVDWTSQPQFSTLQLQQKIHGQSQNEQEVDLPPLPPSLFYQ